MDSKKKETRAYRVERLGENIAYVWYNPALCAVAERFEEFETGFYATYGSSVRMLPQGESLELLKNPLLASEEDFKNAISDTIDFISSCQIFTPMSS